VQGVEGSNPFAPTKLNELGVCEGRAA
jgi:hypothetical protein